MNSFAEAFCVQHADGTLPGVQGSCRVCQNQAHQQERSNPEPLPQHGPQRRCLAPTRVSLGKRLITKTEVSRAMFARLLGRT